MFYTFFIVLLILFTLIFFGIKLSKVRTKIADKLDDVSDIGFDLTGSAEQVTNVSSDLYKSSMEQLDTLSSTISASHEISSMVLRTSDNAVDLTEKTTRLQKMASDGKIIVEGMVYSSLEIKKGSEYFKAQMQESLNELAGTLSVIKEIADKTKIINDIVFQTKLLSFNASVEAARAGEHGKGFSVVAEEIGKLAHVSGKSANEIAAIVEKSLASVNHSVESTREKVEALTFDTAKKSDDGYAQAKNCEDIFSSITDRISEINLMVQEITTATKEQSQGVAQLDMAIVSLQEVADRNRLVSSQSTEHAHSFEKQTRNLMKITEEMKFFLPKRKIQKARLQQFIWNDNLSLGINSMDDEHKILVSKINVLVENLEAQYSKKDTRKLYDAFIDLASYTQEHFAHEEKFMESMSYPQLSSHRKIHQKLLEQVGKYGEQIQNGTLDDRKLISFLRNWLISHIMGIDMQYADQYKNAA